jgi:hypothetical protein
MQMMTHRILQAALLLQQQRLRRVQQQTSSSPYPGEHAVQF